MRGDDVVIDDRGELNSNVVLGHTDLLGYLDDLNLDIDLNEGLAEGIDLDKAGVDCLVEFAEFGDEADISLAYALIRVRAAYAAGNRAEGSNNSTDAVDCW